MLTIFKIKFLKWRIKLLVTRYHRVSNSKESGKGKKEITGATVTYQYPEEKEE
jgi:hypothetical protein